MSGLPVPATTTDTSRGLSRRRFLGVGAVGALGAATSIGGPLRVRTASAGSSGPASELFSLGVASGDPTWMSVVLWTRLALDPLMESDVLPGTVRVRWEVASDAGMAHVVRQGLTIASARHAHSVHVT